MNASQETWRPVVGAEGYYEVSDLGRVRSLDRLLTFPDGRSRRSPGRILKPWKSNRGGYPAVGIAVDGKKRKVFVHVLVLEAFVGPRPPGMACCHGDGNAENNCLANLRWDTYSSNNYDLVKHGSHHNASKTHCLRGHEYTPENTRDYIHNGWKLRYCKACSKIKSRKENEKRKAERAANPKRPGVPRLEQCNRGHQFTSENTYIRPDGIGRSCRKCQAIRQKQKGGRPLESEVHT